MEKGRKIKRVRFEKDSKIEKKELSRWEQASGIPCIWYWNKNLAGNFFIKDVSLKYPFMWLGLTRLFWRSFLIDQCSEIGSV